MYINSKCKQCPFLRKQVSNDLSSFGYACEFGKQDVCLVDDEMCYPIERSIGNFTISFENSRSGEIFNNINEEKVEFVTGYDGNIYISSDGDFMQESYIELKDEIEHKSTKHSVLVSQDCRFITVSFKDTLIGIATLILELQDKLKNDTFKWVLVSESINALCYYGKNGWTKDINEAALYNNPEVISDISSWFEIY